MRNGTLPLRGHTIERSRAAAQDLEIRALAAEADHLGEQAAEVALNAARLRRRAEDVLRKRYTGAGLPRLVTR